MKHNQLIPSESPEKKLEYAERYRQRHAEEIKTRDRSAWRNLSREKKDQKNARSRAYRAAHKKEIEARRVARLLADPEKAEARRIQQNYRARLRQEAFPERYKRYRREHYQRYKERKVHARRQRIYGITQEEYESIFKAQGGVCAICGNADWSVRSPDVDHDHDRNIVRGILCHNCNVSLGLIKESPEIARKMVLYLSSSPVAVPVTVKTPARRASDGQPGVAVTKL